MKVLHLTLKRKWFDLIASGEKKEEYREVKPYWINRLTWHEFHNEIKDLDTLITCVVSNSHSVPDQDVIKANFFECIEFKNGYSKNAPKILVECKGIEVRGGEKEWGAEPGKKYFVIQLGEIIK
jgi:hypothetical protein